MRATLILPHCTFLFNPLPCPLPQIIFDREPTIMVHKTVEPLSFSCNEQPILHDQIVCLPHSFPVDQSIEIFVRSGTRPSR